MKYNVLQLISDQHLADAMGCAGHPQAITPTMDALAARGVRFTKAYTQNPICTPSRVCILAGQYCHNTGYYGLSGPTPHRLPSFLSHFRGHGYHTAAIGKLHLPNDPEDWLADELDCWIDCWDGNQKGGQGPYANYLDAKGLLHLEDERALREFPDGGRQKQNHARPSNLSFDDSVEGWTVARTLEQIDAAGDKPWAMQCSFYRPHQCYTPDQRFWDMYADDLDLPESFGSDITHRAPHFQQQVRDAGLDEATARTVWRGYLACITHVDYAMGRVIDHLEQTGQLDRTIIVYHSDHGAYSTQFGVPEKAPGICSEQVCRVPMVWAGPGVTEQGTERDHFAENIDLGPTFAALAGLPEMDWVDGQDLSALLAGGDEPVRDQAVTEHPWTRSIRFGPWRFVHYPRGMFDEPFDFGELYHIDDDPLETTNLYDDPDYQSVVHEAQRRLLDFWSRQSRIYSFLPQEGELGRDGKMLVPTDDAGRPTTRNSKYL